MNLDRLVAGLDIGSAKTTAIIAEVVGDLPRHPSVNILGVGQARTTGMRRGVVADIEETMRCITKALADAEQMAGARVENVFCGIAGEHVQAVTSKGIASVTGAEISRSDVDGRMPSRSPSATASSSRHPQIRTERGIATRWE